MGYRTLEKYLPTAIVLPFEGHTRQSKLMHAQVSQSNDKRLDLWFQIIYQKISNQAEALSIMGMTGAEDVCKYLERLTTDNIDASEALAAGFHPTFGLHHDSQLNAFNLADDLIEPYRAMVESLKRIVLNNSGEKLLLPAVLPLESMEGITE